MGTASVLQLYCGATCFFVSFRQVWPSLRGLSGRGRVGVAAPFEKTHRQLHSTGGVFVKGGNLLAIALHKGLGLCFSCDVPHTRAVIGQFNITTRATARTERQGGAFH